MQAKTFMLAASAALAAALLAPASAKAISLDTLIAAGPGNMIMVGDVVYSNFTYGGVLPSNVLVTTTATGLSFTTTSGAFTSPDGSGVIAYDVTVTGQNVQSVGLDFQATVTPGAIADVGETVEDLNTNTTYSLQVIDNGDDPSVDSDSDSVTLNPTSNSLHVIKSIDVETAGGDGQLATITLVDNTYTQTGGAPPPPVPEPMSLALLPLALVGLGLRKRLAR